MTTPDAPITSLLELRLRADGLEESMKIIDTTLEGTVARPGCLGVEVMLDVSDPTHVVVVERWESLAHDDDYRAWRATPEGAPDLPRILTGPPVLTRLSAR